MKNLYSLVFALILSINIWAQSPQKMSYQAVIRNSSNALVTSSPVGMQISILQGSATGSVVYAETQTTNTNANGLVSIEIGNGTVVTGTFSAINWANGPYFIKTETDPTGGTAYTISGTSELLSVPYALHAKTAESISGGITETDPAFTASPANGISSADITNWNNKLSSETDPLFAASVASAITSTDVTNWNNKLSIEVDGSVTNELQTLRISNDTVYLSYGGYVKLPAGFNGDYNSLTNKPTAVSSFSNDAGYLTSFTEVDGSVTNELQTLRISNDTIYLSNGGFAKLPAGNAWGLNGNAGTNPNSNFIGTTDDVPLNFRINNFNSGKIERQNNITHIGYNSGNNTNSGHENTSVGANTLNSLTTGWGNSAVGYDVLRNSTTGLFNTGMGYIALNFMTTGRYNTGVGSWALQQNSTGESNAAFGMFSIPFNQTGNYNTSIGAYSGYNATGTGNVFLGYQAGYNESGSNKLHIANSNTTTPLIYGDFSNGRVGIGTTSPSFKLDVTEDASFNGVRVGRGNGNSSTNTTVGFNALNSNTSGTWNTAIGEQALNANTTGYSNTGIGRYSLKSITTGNNNTAVGQSAMYINSTGSNNSAFGVGSLLNQASGDGNTSIGTSNFYNKSSGNNNTALGMEAGFNNATGSNNVFLGYQAGYSETGSNKLYIANSNTTTPLIYGDFSNGRVGIGTTSPSFKLEVTDDALLNGIRVGAGGGANIKNAVLGYQALQSNTTGYFNTAIGYQAMFPNTTGIYNTAVGTAALGGNINGAQNCAYGYASLVTRTASIDNSAYGVNSLRYGTTGDRNSAFGSSALLNNGGNNNTAIGFQAGNNNNTGSGNVFIGHQAGFNETGSNKLYIANSNTTTPLIYGDFSNAKIGIGTITPSKELTVKGDAQVQTKGAWTVGAKARLYLGEDDNIWIEHIHSLGLNLNTASGWKMTFMDGLDENMRIDGNGNVGIGTTAPTAKLEVNGAIKVTGGTASQFLKADGSLDNNTYLTAVVEVADEFSATAAQTSFTLTQTPSANSKIKMYVNGIRISNTAYSVTGTTLTYVPANNGSYSLSAGDRIQFDYSY